MNTPKSLRTILWSTTLAATVAAGLALWAADKPPARPPLKLQVEHQAVNRSDALRISYAAVVKKASPSVVYVFSSKKVRHSPMDNPFFNDPTFRRYFGIPDQGRLPRESVQQSLGSGVIISADGYILTNNHVVDGADEVKVAFGEPRKEHVATIVGRDEKADVAVLKIEATGLPAITVGDSDQLEVGDTVLAIGNPFGVGMTVTHGIVSALGRGGLGIEDYEDFIQTDAPINPGNSGGALLDGEGRLIGINTAILSRTGGSNGIGFAIPINLARSIAEQLISTGHVDRGFLGVTTQALTEELAKQFGVDHGALVTDISPGSGAEKAGLKRGDIITAINEAKIDDPRALALAIARLTPDTEITVHYVRDGKAAEAKAKLGHQSSQSLAGGNAPGGGSDEGVLNGVGVSDLTAETRAQLHVPPGLEGALVTQVDPDSASARAGLREGDLILELDRKKTANAADAVKLSTDIKGPKVLVLLWRDGVRRYLVVDESK
ncbi:MAG TPA: DegQ family serine endoprotease [Lacunisphaera sp.]|nr:DegQ family serine endoprotease [Lacunisphaera sp.]